MDLRCIFLIVFAITIQPGHSIIVDTILGKVSGTVRYVEEKTVNTFLGIPFAQPPIGSLRFAPTKPPRPWTGIYNATRQAVRCSQRNLPSSEDCLYLNVWTTYNGESSTTLKPVMVFIHGGAFAVGSTGVDHGTVLAAHHDVVVVGITYRLGMFGYLNALTKDAPGNAGMHDQIMALRWVKQNVRFFGGNPNQVTLFGQSAGSMSINLLLHSPKAAGLFNRAIMESGSTFSNEMVASPEDSIAETNAIAKYLHCAGSDKDVYSHPEEVLRCMRSKRADEIVRATDEVRKGEFIPVRPSYGDGLVPFNPIFASKRGLFQNGDLLIGTTTDEGSMYVKRVIQSNMYRLPSDTVNIIKDHIRKNLEKFGNFGDAIEFYFNRTTNDIAGLLRAVIDYATDAAFICPSVYFAESYSDRRNSVYFYRFSHRSKLDKSDSFLGVYHGAEMSYVFGTPFLSKNDFTDEDRKLSKEIMTLWTTFAKNGNPKLDVNNNWPKFTTNDEKFVDLNAKQMEIHTGPRQEFCNALRKYF